MTMGAGVIVYLAALYSITMLVAWYFIRRYRIERLPSEEERFVLQEGQTILGVIDTKKTLYICIATDVRGEKSYE